MPRSVNAQLAIDMYEALRAHHGWSAASAWQGIARLLLSCDIWRHGWQPFHDVAVYREANDFKLGARGPNIVMRRADTLTGFLANELDAPRADLCNEVASYWGHPQHCRSSTAQSCRPRGPVSHGSHPRNLRRQGHHLCRGSQPLRGVSRPAFRHPQPQPENRYCCTAGQSHRRAHFIPLALQA